MKKFVKTLIEENKISIVEPNTEVSKAYLEKSSKSLLSSKTLIKIENFNDATALTYYSMYYSLLALLYRCGIKSENHTGSIMLLKELFKINNKDIEKAKKERVDKQYYIDFQSNKEEVEKAIEIAEEFNSKINEKIETIKTEEINKIRKELKENI